MNDSLRLGAMSLSTEEQAAENRVRAEFPATRIERLPDGYVTAVLPGSGRPARFEDAAQLRSVLCLYM